MKKNAGFTLMELMIVVGILSIIAAITIPNLLRSRQTAMEGAALASVRTLATAETSFLSAGILLADGIPLYGTLGDLGSSKNGAPFIDAVLSGGTKQEYSFVVTASSASPATYTATGTSQEGTLKNYFVDESGVIRFTSGGTAPDPTSPPVS